MKYLIIGYGITGKAVRDYLEKKHLNYAIYDKNQVNDEHYFSYEKLKRELPLFDIGIKSPGVRDNEVMSLIKSLCKNVYSEIDFAYLNCQSKHIIGVSGSNGKTSFCSYLEVFLKNKYEVIYCGNNEISFISKIGSVSEDTIIVLELSSYQLEDTSLLNLEYAFFTSLCPNHLNNYYTLQHYYASKKRLFLLTKKLYCLSNNEIFESNYHYENFRLKSLIGEYLIGEYNIIYALCAYKFALEMKVEEKLLNQSVKNLAMVKYRLNIKKCQKFIFVNDSKSTTSSSTCFAYQTFISYPEILIIGGIHKSSAFNINVKPNDKVFIFGRDREKINREINGILFDNLDDIFIYLSKIKEFYYVIFSPGCDSHDQFKNYIDRGKCFDEKVSKYFI